MKGVPVGGPLGCAQIWAARCGIERIDTDGVGHTVPVIEITIHHDGVGGSKNKKWEHGYFQDGLKNQLMGQRELCAEGTNFLSNRCGRFSS